jgi:hypothetical protein
MAAIVVVGGDRPSGVRDAFSAVGADEAPAVQSNFSLRFEGVGVHD